MFDPVQAPSLRHAFGLANAAIPGRLRCRAEDMPPFPIVVLEAENQIDPELLKRTHSVGVDIRKSIRGHHRDGPKRDEIL
jgi:hypothetical protein